ncbi:MAG: hypothetical protein Q9176_007781 [Flavoplaca citrina]
MSQSQLLVKVTQAKPVNGKETYIISTQTFKFQLCIPNEDEHEDRNYYDAVTELKQSVLNGHEKLLQLIDNIAKSSDNYPMEGLRLKLKGQADELEQLAFYFRHFWNGCNDV